jgi:hypothetical protein
MEEHTEEAQSEEEAARLPVMLRVIVHSSLSEPIFPGQNCRLWQSNK